MPKFQFTSAFRQPGLSRKLTIAFGAVILVVAMSLPVSVGSPGTELEFAL